MERAILDSDMNEGDGVKQGNGRGCRLRRVAAEVSRLATKRGDYAFF
eukprot:CAMPEP_0170180988 /NCGR_PEP_ID=MMETSP0040_2-20121228/23610_1 /TAXON_ID=641309 /ORGANISM="Lotharella oceanica, Strain CCMP622" /LENGTH=46 /DNA_ID= /DNA_START= /DNA_END= /DNA_ORIENTATION=